MKKRKFNYFSALILIIGISFLGSWPARPAAAADIKDFDIQEIIEDELILDSAIRSWNIDVEVKDGIATLNGSVENILAANRAVRIARTVKGVRGIINLLKVDIVDRPSDSKLKKDIEKALLRDPVTEAWEITVSIDEGNVTLNGIVESWPEKQLAEKIAGGIDGVRSVFNLIKLDHQENRPDDEIKKEIEYSLYWDVHFDGALIEVQVNEGEVELSGIVGSLAEKVIAGNTARVSGVNEVKNNIEVQRWNRDKELRKNKYVYKKDKDIKKAVEDVISKDPRIGERDIKIKSENGNVTLRGTISTLRGKKASGADAGTVVGVWNVDNMLKVRPKSPISDEDISRDIRDAYLVDPFIERFEIDINVKNGEVYLYGKVGTLFEKKRAEDRAAEIKGVRDVNNFIETQKSRVFTYNPYIDEGYLYDFQWYYRKPAFTPDTDWTIKNKIERQLFWSPFVDSDDVDVEVKNGKAVLTGEVETWEEFRAAARNAFDGGAILVDNELEIEYGPDYYR